MNDQPHPISIVVADDHPVVLHGVADVLRFNSDMNVVAVCSDGATAFEAIRKYSPNVAVLDIAMPGLTGLAVLDHIAADGLATKVVLLAATATDEQLSRAVAGGVRGIVLRRRLLLSSFNASARSPKAASGCPLRGSMQHWNVKPHGDPQANGSLNY